MKPIQPMHPQHLARFQFWIEALRREHAHGVREFALVGYDEICDYLNGLRMRTPKRGRYITPHTVRKWRRERGFPVHSATAGAPATTNILIQAWLGSFDEYQRTKPKAPTS